MHKSRFIHRTQYLVIHNFISVVAGMTAISIAAALCYEQYRKREFARSLASIPGFPGVLSSEAGIRRSGVARHGT